MKPQDLTYKKIANTLAQEGNKQLKVFAFVSIDENNVATTKIFANELNAIKFIEEMKLGTFQQAFITGFEKDKQYNKAD